jgi:hypothetical protein
MTLHSYIISGSMSFTTAYLTPRQLSIWGLRRRGHTQAEIGRHLGVQRQGINEALVKIDAKLSQALTEAAQTSKLEIYRTDTVHGILEAYSHAYNVPVIVSFTKQNGVQVWYLYEGKCTSCPQVQICRNMLKAEARERGINLSNDDLQLMPTALGRKIFDSLTTVPGE